LHLPQDLLTAHPIFGASAGAGNGDMPPVHVKGRVSQFQAVFEGRNGATSCVVQACLWIVLGCGVVGFDGDILDDIVRIACREYWNARQRGMWVDTNGFTNPRCVAAAAQGDFIQSQNADSFECHPEELRETLSR